MYERRAEPRVPALRPIVVDLPGEIGCAGLAEDMSQSGVRIRTAHQVPVGTRVRVRWTRHDGELDVTGVVVRQCARVDHSLFDSGCAVRLDRHIPL